MASCPSSKVPYPPFRQRLKFSEGCTIERPVAVVSQLPRVSRRAAAYWVAAATHLEDASQLDRALSELRALDPDFSIEAFVPFELYKQPRWADQLAADLARAGLKRR